MMDIFNTLSTRGLLHGCSLAKNGQIINFSEGLRQQLGYSQPLTPLSLENILTQESLEKIQQLFLNPPVTKEVQQLELKFIQHNHQFFNVLASGVFTCHDDTTQLHLVCLALGNLGQRLNELENANQVMSEMLYSARVAYWCIEWEHAIDLSLSTDEIVQQVFETPSHWRMCNQAMREVYEMPSDVIFNQQAVRLYWPRSPANEEFVRRLIQSDFCVNGALSVDHRHDGSLAYVENDVQAHIENGKMLRMWGSIYDVSQEFNLQQDAEHRIQALKQVFDAVPDAVVVIDETNHPQWRNAAFEQHFGIIQGTKTVQTLMQSSLMDRAWQPIELANVQGQVKSYHVHCSEILIQKNLTWTVAVLRPAIHQQIADELHA
jgi:PAS domain-containing protein